MAKIRAEFVLDDQGIPKYMSDGKTRHYEIVLSIIDAPEDAIGVTYELDPTYYDALREAVDRDKRFAEKITSYGDYEIRATLRTKLPTEIRSYLSSALERSYQGIEKNEIKQALHDISGN
jgi:hypothetical protein